MKKTACIYHKIDLDGWMSAAIVMLAHEGMNRKRPEDDKIETDYIGWNNGDPIPDLSPYLMVVMCDVAFPVKEMNELINGDKGFGLIWIDHHVSSISNPEIHENRAGGLRSTQYAACELTWQCYFPDQPMPEIVRLLGRWDCMGSKGTPEERAVLEFQYGARQHITDVESAYKALLLDVNQETDEADRTVVDTIMLDGISIYKYLCTEAKQAYKNGFELNLWYPVVIEHALIDGKGGESNDANRLTRFICINKERFNPINFGIEYHKDGYDGAACFHYDGKMWCFSLYNDNGEIDVSKIAKTFGGGGHAGASGFKLSNADFENLMLKLYFDIPNEK